jgi:hypothetical protein
MPRSQTPHSVLVKSDALSREALSRMADAAVKVVGCIEELHESGSNLVKEALRGGSTGNSNHSRISRPAGGRVS